MSPLSSLAIILLLVVINAFFSCVEIALAAAKRLRLEILAKDGNDKATRVLALQDQPGSFFTVIQIGVNIVTILAGIVGEPVLTPAILEVLSFFWNAQPWHYELSVFLSVAIVTLFFIIFADLVPKRLAMAYPEQAAMLFVQPMIIAEKIFKPLAWALNAICKGIFNVIGLPQIKHEHITPSEIHAMVDAGAEAGILGHQEHHLIENIFDLETRYVPSAMTARESIIYFLLNDSKEVVQQKVLEHPHARFLVCDHDIDNVVGYIESKEVLKRLLTGENFTLNDKSLLHVPLAIPDSLNLWEVLERMKTTGIDLAIVVNEYALVVGMVSISDLTSALMGNLIRISEEEQQIVKRDKQSWLMDGLTPLAEVMSELDIDDYPNPVGYETLSGFIMYMMRKIPKKTDFIVFASYKFEVVDIEGNRINQLLVTHIDVKTPVVAAVKEEQ